MPRAAPPWRILAVLALGVLGVHAVLLQTQPAHIGPQTAPVSPRVAAFETRSIAVPPMTTPPETAAPPAAPTPRAAPTRKKPVFKKKVAPVQAARAQPAIESIAEAVPENRTDEAPAAAPDSSSDLDSAPATPAGDPETPAVSEAEPPANPAASTVVAATAPASAAAAPPPGASQTPVTAMALPASVQLDYKMTGSAKGLTYHANGELAWQNTGSVYNASMTVKALFIGSRTLSSTGQVSDQGLAPSRFTDKSRTEVAAHFEPDKGQISFSANTPTLPWTQGAQDRVSVFMQLGGMLAGNPAAFPVGSQISLRTVGPRDADTWMFLVEAEERLSLPFGELATLKLSRKPRHEYDQKLEIWYAPALGYLPVRNKITQANGDFVDQELKTLTRP
ncbi:hypothetical protein RCH06_000435 [Polaromonas sp. CG_9.5]|uniref:DUF3108 domain-containing protein n=1 Tax=Polaromonas sp. CG_9.5 TaxID=3071705 RepID=UPI002DFB28A1|nr:hypothetical protein [Polaromonas sp. CG_9.5]